MGNVGGAISVTSVLVIAFVFASVAVGTGLTSVLRGNMAVPKPSGTTELHHALKLPSSIFLGAASATVTYRFSLSLFNHHVTALSVASAALLAIWLLLLCGRATKPWKFRLSFGGLAKKSGVFLVLSLPLAVQTFMLYPGNGLQANLGNFDSLGGLHGVRTIGLAVYGLALQDMPVTAQNSGHATLLMLSLLFGFDRPVILSGLMLSFSLLLMAYLIYGILRTFQFSTFGSLAGAFFFLYGGSALSVAHVNVVDSGYPLALNGYVDTVIGAGLTMLFALKVLHSDTSLQGRAGWCPSAQSALFYFFILAAITLFTPQNVLFLLPLLLLKTILTKGHGRAGRLGSLGDLASGITGSVSPLFLGTMFTPAGLQHPVELPGIMRASGDGTGVALRLPANNYSVHFDGAIFGPAAGGREQLQAWAQEWAEKEFLVFPTPNAIWAYEEIVWSTIRSVGFTALCLTVLLWLSGHWIGTVVRIPYGSASRFAWTGLAFLAVGLSTATTLNFNGYTAELQRFTLPGVVLGSLAGAIVVAWGLSCRSARVRITVASLSGLATAGPVIDLLSRTTSSWEMFRNGDTMEYLELWYLPTNTFLEISAWGATIWH